MSDVLMSKVRCRKTKFLNYIATNEDMASQYIIKFIRHFQLTYSIILRSVEGIP
jgi:hypothetical protein